MASDIAGPRAPRVPVMRRIGPNSTSLLGAFTSGIRAAMITLLVVPGEGCPQWGQQPAGVDDSTFVAAMADLRRAVQPGGVETARDSAGRAAVRDSILRRYRITAAGLESAARRLASRPDHAADVLRAIDHKVQLATATSNTPAVPGAPSSAGARPPMTGATRARTPKPGLLVPPSNLLRTGAATRAPARPATLPPPRSAGVRAAPPDSATAAQPAPSPR